MAAIISALIANVGAGKATIARVPERSELFAATFARYFVGLAEELDESDDRGEWRG